MHSLDLLVPVPDSPTPDYVHDHSPPGPTPVYLLSRRFGRLHVSPVIVPHPSLVLGSYDTIKRVTAEKDHATRVSLTG